MTSQTSISITDTSRLISEGIVEGATTRACPQPHELKEAFLLPAGKTMTVTPGQAFLMKSGDNQWGRVQFYRAGKMTGPLVYASVEAEPPEDAYRNSIDWGMILAFSGIPVIAGLAGITLVASMLLFGAQHISGIADAVAISATILLCLCCVAISAPTFRKHLLALRRGGDYAIDALYSAQGIPTLRIPLPAHFQEAVTG